MDLVLYGVASARRSIHVLAYVVTYRPLIEALAAKARAGVDVAIAVDYSESVANDRSGYIRRGLDYLSTAGAAVCVVDRFRLMHSTRPWSWTAEASRPEASTTPRPVHNRTARTW